MNLKRNYQKELDKIIDSIPEGKTPSLLLHACCAPCSSYSVEYLSNSFAITLMFYNPNISDNVEYEKRANELVRLIGEMPLKNKVEIIRCSYSPAEFERISKGAENEPEGGARCSLCYELRLRKAAEEAKAAGFDYFASTLSISPLKSSQRLNEIGERLAEEIGVPHLPNDFKKKEGYKRSIELSKEYSLYRQDYCGCVYSKKQREGQ